MAVTANQPFSRDAWAREYAESHLRTDPGTIDVFYLPTNAPEREIRLLEINDLIAVRESDPIDPIDFGVDSDGDQPHRLLVVDVTPGQWVRIQSGQIPLPPGWSLDGKVIFSRQPQ